MIPSMTCPGNAYDNASCDSFLKTLKREEIYANNSSNSMTIGCACTSPPLVLHTLL